MKNTVAVLGSTGSIGVQCLQVCENLGARVAAITGGGNIRLLEQQARRWRPRLVAVADESRYSELKTALADLDTTVVAGVEGVCQTAACSEADTAVNGISGIAGLRPTLAAIDAGKTLALANKESLVTGGALVMSRARDRGVTILPVDSEHSAIFQCLLAGGREDLHGILLTASGGPFFGKTMAELRDAGPREALAHPVWNMGRKISIDSATLMNKGLEFIEAMWLFDLSPEQIEIVVHRQSVIHSAVEFADGAVIAQMGTPDMRTAIQYALTYPARMSIPGVKRLSLTEYGTLTFQKPDIGTFRCLEACLQAAKLGGLAPCVANGANEQAVELFLREEISFAMIGEAVARAVETVRPSGAITLESIEAADRMAREYVKEIAPGR